MKEIWKIIEDFPEYEVSNFGQVRSLKFKRCTILKLMKKENGYMCVNFMKDSKVYQRLVHRLVAKYFIDNPNNYNIVNHIDEIKDNNHFSNLEWVTQRENTHHSLVINKTTSNFVGVHKHLKSWRAEICIEGKSYHLGKFKSEIEASNEYVKMLNFYKEGGLELFLSNRLKKDKI
jgi:hypothetical protein